MAENVTQPRRENEARATEAPPVPGGSSASRHTPNGTAKAEQPPNRAAEGSRAETAAQHDHRQRAPETRFRCLHCGYPLMVESDFRCSECGREHERYVLERWFWGSEENRLERVLWLVRACVFLKLWIFENGVITLAAVASSAAVLWACWQAGQGKRATVAWQYAVAGMSVAGLSLLSIMFGMFGLGTAAIVTLDIVSACLLLIAMLRDADRQELWREPTGSRIALGILVAAPVLGLLFTMFESHTGMFGFTNALGLQGRLTGVFPAPIRFLIPRVTALAVWGFVWYWLAGLKKAMFSRSPHD